MFSVVLLCCLIPAVDVFALPVQNYVPDENGNYYWEPLTKYVAGSHSVLPSLFIVGGARASALPEQYDSRTAGVETDVKVQGGTSACWAIAATDVLQMNLLKQGVMAADFSEAHLAWFAHRSLVFGTERDAGDGTNIASPYIHGGNWVDAAVTLSRWVGPALESDFPFDSQNISSMGNYSESQRRKREASLTSAVCFYSKNNDVPAALSAKQVNAIKQAISSNGAVQMSFYSDGTCYSDKSGVMVYYQNKTYATNHAIVVIGWDDFFSAENFPETCRPSSDGAWLCKNSWGSKWGDDGYFWISYEEASLNQIVSFTADEKQKYDENYQYDGFGFHGRVYSEDYIRFVNVYTADSDCELAAVGTWFLQDGAPYTIDVYKNIDVNTGEPVGKTAAATVSGAAEFYGYRVIDLDETVFVKKGETFSVAVTLTADSDCKLVNAGIENKNADDFVSSSKTGQSFVQIEREGKWYDTAEEGLNNVCLKVFTAHNHFTSVVGMRCEECGEMVSVMDLSFVRRLVAMFRLLLDSLPAY